MGRDSASGVPHDVRAVAQFMFLNWGGGVEKREEVGTVSQPDAFPSAMPDKSV